VAVKVDLTLNESNDEDIEVTLTTNKPAPGTALDLTGKTLEAYLKPSAATADADGSVWKGTSAAEITITDAVGGKATIAAPGSAVQTTKKWWRIDVLNAGKRKTALYGDVAVTDL
jgi:hypothetical protein